MYTLNESYSKPLSDSSLKSLVVVCSLLSPLLGGAIIYYSMKRRRPDLARLGNLLSFVSMGLIFLLVYLQNPIGILLIGLIQLSFLPALGLTIWLALKVNRQFVELS